MTLFESLFTEKKSSAIIKEMVKDLKLNQATELRIVQWFVAHNIFIKESKIRPVGANMKHSRLTNCDLAEREAMARAFSSIERYLPSHLNLSAEWRQRLLDEYKAMQLEIADMYAELLAYRDADITYSDPEPR